MKAERREAADLSLRSPFACCVIDPHGAVRFGNHSFWALVGVAPPPPGIPVTAPTVLASNDVHARWPEVHRTGRPAELSVRLGGRALGCFLFPVRDGVAALFLELDESRPAVRQAEYHRLFNTVSEAIYIQDRDGVFLDVNDAAVRMYGYEKEELVGQTPAMLADPERVDMEATLERVQRAFEGQPQMFEWWGRRKNGEIFPKEVTVVPGTYYGQEVVIALSRDVTERKRAEEASRHAELREMEAERLRVLGQLAAGVAHDFNNALTAILGYSQAIQRDLSNQETLAQGLQVIEQAARGAAVTVRRIQSFARQREDQDMAPTDLRPILREAVALSRPRIEHLEASTGQPFRIRTRIPSTALAVRGSEAGLRDVFVNLLFNALDAMPQGGTVEVVAREEGDHAVVEVRDDGVGMDAATRARIFEPFFTTKGSHGTGLGLPVSHGTIRRHGGELDVQSEVGAGTAVRVRLPRDTGPTEQAQEPAPATRSARVLVVDDDALVRRALGNMLSRMGHRVMAVDGGLQALERLEAETFDLVLTDLSMPGMGGAAVVRAIHHRHPGVKVVVITGYAPEDEMADGLRLAHAVLHKPITLAELAQTLTSVLDV